MRYKIVTWTINQLLDLYEKGSLNLNPPYQRNDIWIEKAQTELISSIMEGMPIPNFFVHERNGGKYDIADGQQRTRAIIAYKTGEITDAKGMKYNDEKDFLEYILSVIIVNKDVSQEEIRNFYVKVNNTGLRLNSPELTKSRYFNSKILKLVEELCAMEQVQELMLFSQKQEDRMLDREFMEELVAQLFYGITEKKLSIKKLYEENTDITETKITSVKRKFLSIIKVFSKINEEIDVASTRYTQKNDFYTLFGLINDNSAKQDTYKEIFKFLVRIQDDISPSNSGCQLLQEYAFNCITQSHGKPARERRYEILRKIAFNNSNKISVEQKQLIKYYELKQSDMKKIEDFILLDYKKVTTKFRSE
jgi:hypothetical protein